MIKGDAVLIIDFGSQYSSLISKKIRDQEIYADIVDCDLEKVKDRIQDYKAIVFSGGPESVENSSYDGLIDFLVNQKKPILCICFGMQLIHKKYGGTINFGDYQEFGDTLITKLVDHDLLKGLPEKFSSWMSHNDSVVEIAPDFQALAKSDSCVVAAAWDQAQIYTLQFHPEVDHFLWGDQIFQNFLFSIANLKKWWRMEFFLEDRISNLRERIGNRKVLLAVSGGIDSSVVAALLKRAKPESITGVFVDTGLLPAGDSIQISEHFNREFDGNFFVIDGKDKYFEALRGISNPEEKRRVVGECFLDLFVDFLKGKNKSDYLLAQGTIQSDLIESGKKNHGFHSIKTHHNTVFKLREEFELLEPLSDLFKNEVRELAAQLELPEFILNKHPFPGPGYSIRIMGEVTEEKVDIIRRVDSIFIERLRENKIYGFFSQAFSVLLNTKSVGIKGDVRCYGYVVALRAVHASNFMTANSAHLNWDLIVAIGSEIVNKVPEVCRVVYDVTNKPPGTIEWE